MTRWIAAVAIKQIGMVHHERFNDARAARRAGRSRCCSHAQAAEQHYQQALALCPPTAVADLGPMHNQLGNLYAGRRPDRASPRALRESRADFEQTGDRYGAGQTRYNLALMYLHAAEREATPGPPARPAAPRPAYAQAALRDFQHYQGRAAADEAKAQGLIDHIERALG